MDVRLKSISIPFLLEATALLAAFTHTKSLSELSSWGFAYLPPHCNFNYFGDKIVSCNQGEQNF